MTVGDILKDLEVHDTVYIFKDGTNECLWHGYAPKCIDMRILLSEVMRMGDRKSVV